MNANLRKALPVLFLVHLFRLFGLAPLRAQPEIDSLKQLLVTKKEDSNKVSLLLRIAKRSSAQSNDTGILYGRMAYQLSLKINRAVLKYRSASWLSECYGQKGTFQDALEYALLSLRYADESKDTAVIVEANVNTAKLYSNNLSNLSRGLEFARRALQLAEATHDLNLIIDGQECMAAVYSGFDKDKALYYDKAAYTTALRLKDDQVTMVMLSCLASCYSDRGEYTESYNYYRKAIAIALVKGKPFDLAALYHNTGNACKGMKDYKLALDYYLKSLTLVKQYNIEELAGMCYISLSETSIELKDYKGALQYNQQGIAVEVKRGSQQRQSFLYMIRARAYDSLHDYRNAYLSYRKYHELASGANDNASRNKMLDVEAKRTAELNRKELDLIDKDRALQRAYRNLLIAGLVMLMVLAILLVRNARLKRNVEIEKMRNALSRDLHDDIGSTLSSINILSRTAYSHLQATHDDRTKASLEKINDRSQRLLDSMSDIIWNIRPGNDTIEEVMSRMREYATTVLEAKNINYTFNFPNEKMDCKLTMAMKNNLYLIFKEAVNNLSKYSGATNALLSLTFTEKQMRLAIEDNGKGFAMEQLSHKGGLSNMRQRAEDIGGTIDIAAAPGKGVSIVVVMPRYCK